MKFLIKKLDDKALIPFKADGHEADFCYDCVAVSEKEVHPGVWKYGLGFALQPVNDCDGAHIRGINLRARSSVYKTGMVLSNSQGTIDEIYTGELSAVFYHVVPSLPRYKVGDKVCQICLERTEPLDFELVDELRKTARGANGYGSSDKEQS